jgi:peroxiredoxin
MNTLRLKLLMLPLFILFAMNGIAEEVPVAIKIGEMASPMELKDLKGVVHRIADYKGKVVVLEWTNPECPFVKRHYNKGTMKALQSKYQPQGVVWLAISSTSTLAVTKLEEWGIAQKLNYPLINDPMGVIGMAYGAQTTPHMFIIDQEGKLAYGGAIDSDPYGDEEKPKSFFEDALIAILSGKEPLVAQTTPYGCSVKYPQ